jgi:hypothetical protein
MKDAANLTNRTSQLAISYLDAFLSTHQFVEGEKEFLSYYAFSCLLLAAKFEGDHLQEMVMEKQQQYMHLRMQGIDVDFIVLEKIILTSLKWKLNHVVPQDFFSLCVEIENSSSQIPEELKNQTEKLIELAGIDYRFNRFSSQEIVLGSFLTASIYLGQNYFSLNNLSQFCAQFPEKFVYLFLKQNNICSGRSERVQR